MWTKRKLRVIILALLTGSVLAHMYHGGFFDTIQRVPLDNLIDTQREYRLHQHHYYAHLSTADEERGLQLRPPRRESVISGGDEQPRRKSLAGNPVISRINSHHQLRPGSQCLRFDPFKADIDAMKVYPHLEFKADWIHTKQYWSLVHERRYQLIKSQNERKEGVQPGSNSSVTPSLKVFVIPHSHNDPGWHRTFEAYFAEQTQQILDNVVEKMTEFKTMKFLWSEVSFLSKWWEQARPGKRRRFKQLVAEGRLEIVTGGWVMTDEATVTLYSMIDQLIEGHQWVKAHLGIVPNSSWSVDPFGHSSVLPYILQASSISGMVIQRIHFGWKKWFADQQNGDFKWVQRWDTLGKHPIRCHHAPWSIYSIKHSCGPFPAACLNFDFRKIPGERANSFGISTPITSNNVREKAELLLEQYGRTASLFPHNIAMISLGDDFRFDRPIEWDQQYENYRKLFEYINAHRAVYNADVNFGTLNDYFKAVEERHYQYPTLSGDFFVYSDIYVEGRPAYWSGYYSTRPYWKKFYRETENVVRGAEILFTFAHVLVAQSHDGETESKKYLRNSYQQLITARRWLSLFSHHDATTGTSKHTTMKNYGEKLLEAYQLGVATQLASLSVLLFGSASNRVGLRTDYELKRFGELPRPLSLQFKNPEKSIKGLVFYNSLGRRRTHLARMVVKSPNVEVLGPDGQPVVVQLNPIWESTGTKGRISDQVFEVAFLAELAPLSVTVYQVMMTQANTNATVRSVINCNQCRNPGRTFEVNALPSGDIQLKNERLSLHFHRHSRFLLKVTKLSKEGRTTSGVNIEIKYGGYPSINHGSGAYLLLPNTSAELDIPFKQSSAKLFLVSGPLYSELRLNNAPISLSTRVMHTGGEMYEEGIYLGNQVNLREHDAEIFMRFVTNVRSGAFGTNPDGTLQPSFFTDQNGYTFERRTTIPKIGYEGNTYSVNSMAYLQDQWSRVTLMMDRAHGCSSMNVGWLECVIERRTHFDDGRGMGEGVTDNRLTSSNYVLYIEDIWSQELPISEYQRGLPTLSAHHLSRELSYPAFMYVYDDDLFSSKTVNTRGNGPQGTPTDLEVISLLNQGLPEDVNLINLRTLTDDTVDYDLNLPSARALMITQRVGYLCRGNGSVARGVGGVGVAGTPKASLFYPNTQFNGVKVTSITQTDLTGVSSSRQGSNNRNLLKHLYEVRGEPFEVTSAILAF